MSEGDSLPTLLIVDDDALIGNLLSQALSDRYRVIVAQSRRQTESALVQLGYQCDFALVDLGLPPAPHQPTEGFAVIGLLRKLIPKCIILVVSGQDSSQHGMQARTMGALDYISKPADPERIHESLQSARIIENSIDAKMGFIGDSAQIDTVRTQIRQVASSSLSVLIQGETGTGKELAARAIHQQSRPHRPFVTISCASIPHNLLEPTLFGYAKGAFSGATHSTHGYISEAQDGTLFFDEVADLSLDSQARLLRVLETGEYRRVGEAEVRTSSARLIFATNQPVEAAMAQGKLRSDFYYRIGVFSIKTPSLRDLGDDKQLLLAHFQKILARDLHLAPFQLDEDALSLWRQYPFMGNVRECRNIAARLLVKYTGTVIDEATLAGELSAAGGNEQAESLAEIRNVIENHLKSRDSAEFNGVMEKILTLSGGALGGGSESK